MTTREKLIRTLVAVVALVTLSGCSELGSAPTSGMPSSTRGAASGQSLEQARRQLESIGGLSDTSIKEEKTVSGLSEHHQVFITGTVADPASASDLVDQLAQLGWSVNEAKPDTGVFIRLKASPQPVVGDLAKQQGWSSAGYATSTDDLKQLVLLPADALQERFGAWPGSVPSS